MAIAIVKPDSMKTGFVHDRRQEILVDVVEDLEELEIDDVEPGSIAYTADMSHIYQMSPSGEWVEIGI